LGMTPEGEHVRMVEPLEVAQALACGPSLDQLSALDSFALFRDRVRAVAPTWQLTEANTATVSAIIKLTEGIPLSIELAAARAGDFTLEEIRRGITSARSEFLSRTGMALDQRHASIRACIDWTFNLLPPDGQILFSRLAVFAGGFFATDVKAVCQMENASELLAQLKSYSLLSREERLEQSRYQMLGTIRDYAVLKLGAERESFERIHADHFLKVLISAANQF